ncbi:esterase, partial [Klebsiella pneumoniae]|nr:esterase [Klebsiella pneumoniae]
QLAGVPVLHVVKSEKQDARLPLIFFINGFTSAKEHNLHLGYLLAEAGYRAVLPDALFHGERDEGLIERILQLSFWDIVVRTITEIE